VRIVTGVDGITLQEMAVDHTQKQNYKDKVNYIRAISYLCKIPGSRSKCIIHDIERLNRYYGIPPEFRAVYLKYKVKDSFRFKICQYLTELNELTYNSK